MPGAKDSALKIIDAMPEEASLEDIMYELYFRQRVDQGLQELEEGKTVSHDEIEQDLSEWRQSAGQ